LLPIRNNPLTGLAGGHRRVVATARRVCPARRVENVEIVEIVEIVETVEIDRFLSKMSKMSKMSKSTDFCRK
jgi:hypothetical protein